MSGKIELSTSDRALYSKEIVDEYTHYIKTMPKKTPQELVDAIYFSRQFWFDNFSDADLDHFSNLLEKVSLSFDVDINWDVPINMQMKASEAFNDFIKEMSKRPFDKHKDPVIAQFYLNAALSKHFGLRNSDAILMAVVRNTHLKEVVARMVRELSRMGYAVYFPGRSL